ncbi:MAG: Gfo/Idh/MocA family protein [Armatimonadota bacterium]
MAALSGKNVVRFGIIGVGGMGQGHCNRMGSIEEVALTAVCDIDPVTAKEVGEKYHVPSFTAHAELLAAGLCDAVLIATPHPERPPIAIDAMKAGLHVISEKPLSERISTADAMVATAKEMGVVLGIMFQRRTEPVLAKAIEIARSGVLGKVYRTTMISPEYRSQAYYDSGGWRATWAGEGGGVMMNQSPHILDLFIQIGGTPSSVYGRTETRLHRIEVEDIGEAMLTYPDGGSGYLYCSTNEAGPGQMIEVFGDCGKLIYRDGVLKLYRFEPSITEFTRTSTKMWGGPQCTEETLDIPETPCGHDVITRNFARHLLYDEPLIAPGEDGIASLELANAIWLSAYLNKPVDLPISRAAYDAMLTRFRTESTFVKGVVGVHRETDPQHVK